MKISELLDSLPPLERERFIGRIEGMQMARRICRNRSEDIKTNLTTSNEAAVCAELIRGIQVSFGNGTMKFGAMSEYEQDQIDRIC